MIAGEFFTTYSNADIKKKLKIRNVVVACIAAVTVFAAGCIVFETIKSDKADADYFVAYDAEYDAAGAAINL